MRKDKYGVYSPFKGKVKYALKTASDYGRRVYIEYPTCILMFAHLEEFFVKEGQEVEVGEIIGLMGNSGYGGDVHLHISAFSLSAPKLTAEWAVDPTFLIKLGEFYPTNTYISNGYGSKYCNPKLDNHEGLDFSGVNFIPGWEDTYIDPLYQNYRTRFDNPEDYT